MRINLRLAFLTVFSLLFLYTSVEAQKVKTTKAENVGMSSDRLERITEHFQSYIDNNQFAGIQTLVARKGQVVHFESNGFASKEDNKKINGNTIFRIYSMSKPITSVALMMLFEEGKVQLDDPVHKYIPEFKDLKAVVKDDKSGITKPITRPMKVIDLMRHTSGLGYGWGKGTYVDSLYRTSNGFGVKDLEAFGKKVAGFPLYFEPGTAWRYGISTDILGRVVEVVAGQPLDQYFQEKIFEPLKMENTFFQVPDKKVKRFATCYKPTKTGTLEVQDDPKESRFAQEVTLFSGGGGLLSTTHDYYQFCQMLLNGGALNGNRLLSPKTIELMTQNHVEGINYHGGPVYYPNKAEGFGLGFSVTTNLAQTQNLGSADSYGWGGAAGTYFKIDPKEELIIIQMIQMMPYAHLNHQQEFHTLVYQAITE